MLAYRAWTEEQELVDTPQLVRDGIHEPRQMLLAVGLVGALITPSAMADHRIVANVARRPMMCWHLGLESLDGREPVTDTDDDGLARVDPDQCR